MGGLIFSTSISECPPTTLRPSQMYAVSINLSKTFQIKQLPGKVFLTLFRLFRSNLSSRVPVHNFFILDIRFSWAEWRRGINLMCALTLPSSFSFFALGWIIVGFVGCKLQLEGSRKDWLRLGVVGEVGWRRVVVITWHRRQNDSQLR